MNGPMNPVTEAEMEATMNAYRNAIQRGAAYICETLPPTVVALLHADLAAYIYANETTPEHAAQKFDELAEELRRAGIQLRNRPC